MLEHLGTLLFLLKNNKLQNLIEANMWNPTANHSNVLQWTSSILGLGSHGQQLQFVTSMHSTDQVAKVTHVEKQQAAQTFVKYVDQ